MKLVPMLQVADVEASSRWYQEALGLRSGHGGPDYEMLYSGDDFLLQLHKLDAHEHGFDLGTVAGGGGASLWFGCADNAEFESTYAAAVATGADVLAEPNWNPLAHHYEAALRDIDGYAVVVHGPFGSDGPDAS